MIATQNSIKERPIREEKKVNNELGICPERSVRKNTNSAMLIKNIPHLKTVL
jgi:hypothetical protein